MKILVDENIPCITVEELKLLGHDVKDIRGTAFEGIHDEKLWKMARDEKRLLITTDKGFAQYREHGHSGILIIRLKQPNRKKIHDRVLMALKRFSEKKWHGIIVTVRDETLSLSK